MDLDKTRKNNLEKGSKLDLGKFSQLFVKGRGQVSKEQDDYQKKWKNVPKSVRCHKDLNDR